MAWFGPAGTPESFSAMGYKRTEQMPQYLEAMGLNAFEFQCGRGVRVRQEAAEAGVDDFLPKPFLMSTFESVVRRLLRRQEEKESAGAGGDVIRGQRVLIVDDIEINRIVLSKIMTSLGAQCDTAVNGQDALEKFESSRPGAYDLILMDLQMPVLDGCGAARAIRACGHPSAASIPIIAVTANAFADDVRAALDAGMNAHIAKPVQTDQLRALLQQTLG